MMKNFFLILLFLSSIGFATTLREDPLCATSERIVALENSPFTFKQIKISGPHVVLQGQDTSLTFNCAQDINQFQGTRTVKDIDDEFYQVKTENKDWLVIQENEELSKWRVLAFAMLYPVAKKNKLNLLNIKPIVITNKNENPARTKVILDQVKRTVDIVDPSNPDQSLRFSCDTNGGLQMNVRNKSKKSNFQLVAPVPTNTFLEHKRGGYKYNCYPKMSYNFEKESFDFEKVEKVYTDEMSLADFKRKFGLAPMPPPAPLVPTVPLLPITSPNMNESGTGIPAQGWQR
jgi:hypothetical protein